MLSMSDFQSYTGRRQGRGFRGMGDFTPGMLSPQAIALGSQADPLAVYDPGNQTLYFDHEIGGGAYKGVSSQYQGGGYPNYANAGGGNLLAPSGFVLDNLGSRVPGPTGAQLAVERMGYKVAQIVEVGKISSQRSAESVRLAEQGAAELAARQAAEMTRATAAAAADKARNDAWNAERTRQLSAAQALCPGEVLDSSGNCPSHVVRAEQARTASLSRQPSPAPRPLMAPVQPRPPVALIQPMNTGMGPGAPQGAPGKAESYEDVPEGQLPTGPVDWGAPIEFATIDFDAEARSSDKGRTPMTAPSRRPVKLVAQDVPQDDWTDPGVIDPRLTNPAADDSALEGLRDLLPSSGFGRALGLFGLAFAVGVGASLSRR